MATNQLHPPSAEALKQGYEPETTRVRGLVIFLVCLVLTAAVIHVSLWYFDKWLLGQKRVADAKPSALADLPLPPSGAPPLQPVPEHDKVPSEDLADLRRSENAVFAHLGWKVNPPDTSVEIPDDVVAAVEARESAARRAGPSPTMTVGGQDAAGAVGATGAAGAAPVPATEPVTRGATEGEKQ